jgi:hypothetical protein
MLLPVLSIHAMTPVHTAGLFVCILKHSECNELLRIFFYLRVRF